MSTLNSLWPRDVTWWHRYGSTLAQISVSVIDQVVQFTALFVIWFLHFRYRRSIRTLVFEWQEGRGHFTEGISSWDLVSHDQPSLVCLNAVSYQSLMWRVRRINLEVLCQDQMFAECKNLEGICCVLLFLITFLHHFVVLRFHILKYIECCFKCCMHAQFCFYDGLFSQLNLGIK